MTRKGDDQAERAALARRLHGIFVRVCAEEPRNTLLIVRPVVDAASSKMIRRITPGPEPLLTIARQLRPLVRGSDEIYVDGERSIAIVLRGTGYRGGLVVVRRMVDAFDGWATPGAFGAHWRHDDTSGRLAIGCGEVTQQDLATPEGLTRLVERAWRQQATFMPTAFPRRAMTYPPVITRETLTRITNPPRRRMTSMPLTGASARAPEKARSVPLSRRSARRTPKLRLLRGGKPRYSEEAMRQHAQALGVPFLRLPRGLPGVGWHGISAELAQELRAVPVGCSRHVLTVAMDNPRDIAAVLRLRAITGLSIFPVLALPEELDRALEQIAE